MSSSLQFSLSSCCEEKRKQKKKERHSRYPKFMTCSSWFYPMCALAPLLADVTTCAAVHWTLCREAEKHLKESKTKWEGGLAPPPQSCVQLRQPDLSAQKDVLLPSSTKELGVRRGCAWRHLTTESSPASPPE